MEFHFVWIWIRAEKLHSFLAKSWEYFLKRKLLYFWQEVENISWKEVENISWKENFYLVWWTASAVKGKRLVGIATCCQGPQNLWYLFHPYKYIHTYLKMFFAVGTSSKIYNMSRSAQLIFLMNFKGWDFFWLRLLVLDFKGKEFKFHLFLHLE